MGNILSTNAVCMTAVTLMLIASSSAHCYCCASHDKSLKIDRNQEKIIKAIKWDEELYRHRAWTISDDDWQSLGMKQLQGRPAGSARPWRLGLKCENEHLHVIDSRFAEASPSEWAKLPQLDTLQYQSRITTSKGAQRTQ